MKALFVTTRTGDCSNHVQAWEAVAGPADRIMHTPNGVRNDMAILKVAKQERPSVIFYIGGASGPGIPMVETFSRLRSVAPLVNLCSDAADEGWQERLREYRTAGCFDLHVSLDGAENEYIDHTTVTPVSPLAFSGPPVERDIRCGFSGSYGSPHVWHYKNHDSAYRGRAVMRLKESGQLQVRQRTAGGKYTEHVAFMRRCKVALNVSLSGSATAHQIKGRAIEAGWAGCALLESMGSPAIDRFPKGSVLPFETVAHASEILRHITDEEIARSAGLLAQHIRTRWHPARIYGDILDLVRVDHSF
jgi:hypothetical protein